MTGSGIVDQEGKLASLTVLIFKNTYVSEDIEFRRTMFLSNVLLIATSAIDEEISPKAIETSTDELLEEFNNLVINSRKTHITSAPKTIGRVTLTATAIMGKALRFDLTPR